ncbi:hypothetical protein ACFPRL_07900 [Pseudoclavibacter helvolus]
MPPGMLAISMVRVTVPSASTRQRVIAVACVENTRRRAIPWWWVTPRSERVCESSMRPKLFELSGWCRRRAAPSTFVRRLMRTDRAILCRELAGPGQGEE